MNFVHPNQLRITVLEMVYNANSGHIGGSFSLAETFFVLFSYFPIVSSDSEATDVLILSKGHAVPIYYAALHHAGLIDRDELSTFRSIDSRLQGHPDVKRLKHVQATTGSLGQGLSIAIGRALANHLLGISSRVFCILGDGEMQEGQIWEGLMFLSHNQHLNITVLLDDNKYQNDWSTSATLNYGAYSDHIAAFNIPYQFCDGHCVDDIYKSLLKLKEGVGFLHLDTTKGKGVDFMEGPDWHAAIPDESQYLFALNQLKLF